MTREKFDALTAPVPADEVMTRTDKGKPIDYVSWSWVVRRLNAHCGLDWSFEITHFEDDGKEARVFGALTIAGNRRCNDGFEDNSKFWTTPGQRYKSATSDCLKRCAALFGIALDLYGDDEKGAQRPPEAAQGPNADKPATPDQIELLRSMGRSSRLTKDERIGVAAFVKETPTARRASEGIDRLKTKLEARRNNAPAVN